MYDAAALERCAGQTEMLNGEERRREPTTGQLWAGEGVARMTRNGETARVARAATGFPRNRAHSR